MSVALAPTRPAAGRPAGPHAGSVTDDNDRRQTTTDASQQNNTGPLGGPVIINKRNHGESNDLLQLLT